MCGYAIRTPPPAPQKPSCPPRPPQYPFQQVVADFISTGGHTYIAVADRLSDGSKWEHLSGRPHQCTLIKGFSDDGSSASASQRSCRAMGERTPTSQESRGFLDTWGCAAEGLISPITPSLTAAQRRQSVCPKGCYAATLAGTAPWTPTPLHGPSCSTLNHPPQGSEASQPS
ncbi:hypothetical protein GWK47_044349 [Chionoecetes opilio]|uniref:Uncharacterized protein n=1 Tax=Chionoecetes opilio TaxID=41210 RepID=A0A8J4Y8E6_CHIOP|nr:hypothetical protein GWK47_044349 [Chionoecetes opilio]